MAVQDLFLLVANRMGIEQDLREYRKTQSIHYYKHKLETTRPVTQFVLGHAKQAGILHSHLEPYVSLAAQRWIQQRNQAVTTNPRQDKVSGAFKLLSEKNKLGGLKFEEPVTFAAANNFLCELPLTVSCTGHQKSMLYRQLAFTKYLNYLEALDATSTQLKKRFRSECCKNIFQPRIPVTKDDKLQVSQTIPKEYVELAAWRYQQFVQTHSLNDTKSEETQPEHTLGRSATKLGRVGGQVLVLSDKDSSNIETIQDYRREAAHSYLLFIKSKEVYQDMSFDTKPDIICPKQQEEQLFVYSEYCMKPDCLYRNIARNRYERYLQDKWWLKRKQIESSPPPAPLTNKYENNIFLSQPAVLFQKSNPAVPYPIQYESIEHFALFHSKVMNRFS